MINWLIGLFPHTCIYVKTSLWGHHDITWHECKYCSKNRGDGSYLDLTDGKNKLNLKTGLIVDKTKGLA